MRIMQDQRSIVGQVIVIVVVSIFYEARRIFTELVVPILGSVISQ